MFRALSLSQRLSQIIEPLRSVVAAHGGRHRADVPLVVLLHAYLNRLARRFASLARRLDQNRVVAAPRAPRTDHPASDHPASDRPAPGPRRPRLPQGVAWLIRLSQGTAVYGSQLRHLLGEPEMKELFAASPQAGAILRPLCRMLGIEPHPHLPPSLFPTRQTSPKAAAAAPAGSPEPPSAEPRMRVTDLLPPPPPGRLLPA